VAGHRCFIAVRMSEEVRASVEALLVRLKGAGADVKWVKPDALHLTLKFLGEIPSERVEVVKTVLREVASGHGRFELRVSDIGGFPSVRNPRVIWAGISSASELVSLQMDVEARLVAEGFERENRPFSPHLTLGRIRSKRNMDDALRILEEAGVQSFGRVEVGHVVLMESRLKPAGAEYTPLLEAELGTGR